MERAGATARSNNAPLWLWVPGRASLARDDVGKSATRTLSVVPAKAGTHNHRTWRWSELGPQLASTTRPCGYGSRVALRLPGTTWERAPPAHSVSSLRKQGPMTTGRGWSELGPQLASTTQPCGYGSRVALRLPGTTWERAPPAHSVSSLRKQGPITTGRGDGASWATARFNNATLWLWVSGRASLAWDDVGIERCRIRCRFLRG